jgi:5-methylcytosine-specific restriction endonuclease McrA
MVRRSSAGRRKKGRRASVQSGGAGADGIVRLGTSRRTTPLPPDWATPGGLREQTLNRDGYVCQIALVDRCTVDADEVDHIVPAAKGGSDDLSNLQAACKACHAWKTGREAAMIRHTAEKESKRRDHPGLLG